MRPKPDYFTIVDMHPTDPTDKRLLAILERLGPEASEQDAHTLAAVLDQAYPGVPIEELPAEMFNWLRAGEGSPPVVAVIPASATSLLGIYVDLSETQRAQLLTAAQAISRS